MNVVEFSQFLAFSDKGSLQPKPMESGEKPKGETKVKSGSFFTKDHNFGIKWEKWIGKRKQDSKVEVKEEKKQK